MYCYVRLLRAVEHSSCWCLWNVGWSLHWLCKQKLVKLLGIWQL